MTVLRAGSASDTGLVRTTNQDLSLVTASLFAVADGMGGHAGGEVAAEVAINEVSAAFSRKPSGAGLAEAVSSANTAVWNYGEGHPELRGMGTTMTAIGLVYENGRDVLALVNVGDSRGYRFHLGELEQITADHSVAEEMVRQGEITPAEAAVHPRRHILTRVLGVAPEVDVDLWRILPSRGDRYLLCSDGLTNEVPTGEIAAILARTDDPQQAADQLVRAAKEHGGSDNITAVVVDVVIGEVDSGSMPAVAPVSGDFVISARQLEGYPATNRPSTVPELRPETRREQRRHARRERRLRGRRLVSIRTAIFVVLLAAIVVAGAAAVRWFDTNSYYVGLNGNELVIYQGRIGGFLWFHPVEVERTGVTTADVPGDHLQTLKNGVEEISVADARKYVSNLVAEQSLAATGGLPSTGGGPPPVTVPSTVPTGPVTQPIAAGPRDVASGGGAL